MTHKPNKNYDQIFALVVDKDTSQTHCVWAFRQLGSWSLGGIYPCFNYAFFFSEKGPENAGFSENKCIWNTELFIYLFNKPVYRVNFVCWNKLTWNTCWRNGTRSRLVASNRRAYRGRWWAPRDAREMWRSMRGERRLCRVALLPLAACRAWCANSRAQGGFGSSRQVINGSR